MAARLFPGRHVIPIEPGEEAAAILHKLPERLTHFIFQLNCTDTTRFIRSKDVLLRGLEERGVRVINGRVVDISKRRLQQICLEHGLHATIAAEDGDPEERLIVKTNMNAAAAIERKVLNPLDRERLAIAESGPLLTSIRARFNNYPVLSRREIPAEWFSDNQLIIEHFVENRFDRFYRVHVLFDRIAVTDAICSGPTKKLGEHVSDKVTTFYRARDLGSRLIENSIGSVLQQVRMVQQFLQFDFAGIDVVIDDDGRPFVIDVNTTPFAGPTAPDNPIIQYLSQAVA
jgi:hypothetical protein